MTPIEWNDSEPGFPDFLPPKATQPRLTSDEARERIEGVLKSAGIRLSIWSSDDLVVDAEFPDGSLAVCVDVPSINADGLNTRR